MHVFCEFCHNANRANANFCTGCASKLPGFAATGPSALEILKGAERRRSVLPAPGLRAAARDAHASSMAEVLRPLIIGGLVLMLGFVAWYMHVRREPAATTTSAVPSNSVVVLRPAFDQIASLAPDLSALPAVSPEARAAAARTNQRLLSSNAVPGASRSNVTATDASGAMDTVARFYRALAAGDGRTAAQSVTAAKRMDGPLSGDAMASFYRSLEEPLRIRSIRQLEGQLFEARYTYRATRTVCEGRALLTMESPEPSARIRTISANC